MVQVVVLAGGLTVIAPAVEPAKATAPSVAPTVPRLSVPLLMLAWALPSTAVPVAEYHANCPAVPLFTVPLPPAPDAQEKHPHPLDFWPGRAAFDGVGGRENANGTPQISIGPAIRISAIS